MFKSIMFSIAKFFFKKHVLPELKKKSDKALAQATKNIVKSAYNPIADDTVHDVEDHMRHAMDDLFKEFE